MQHREYNGWTNYETWAANLWIDNDEGSQRYWAEIAEQSLEDNDGDTDGAMGQLANAMECYHDDMLQELNLGYGLLADLLQSSLHEVNWTEIASHYMENAVEQYQADHD